MSEKLPQPTAVLVKRLQRFARRLERYLAEDWIDTNDASAWRARANLCWQAAGRLEELAKESEGNT